MAGELDRVSRELSCLQSVIAEPDELNAEPASDYETLRRQYLSLRLLTNSALARNRYLCRRDDRDMRAALSVNAANVSAERDTNAMLTDLLEKAEAERDALHAEAEALRVVLHEIASVNPAERGIEWAKSYASDGLKGAGSELYARWLDTFKEAEALRADSQHWKKMHAGSMALRMSAEFEHDELRAEAEALRAEIEEMDALLNRQADLLRQTAIALRGPEPALTRYSHADIPSRVKTVVAELEVARGLLCEAREAYAEAIHCEDQQPVMKKIDAFLDATLSPEVRRQENKDSLHYGELDRRRAAADFNDDPPA